MYKKNDTDSWRISISAHSHQTLERSSTCLYSTFVAFSKMMRLCKQEGHVEMCLSVYYNHVKVSSYIALFLILRLVKTLYFHSKPVHQQIPFLHPATMREDCSYTYPPLSVARYSFIQLGELEQCRLKNICPRFEHRSTGFEPGFTYSRVRSSTLEPLHST